MSHFFDRLVGAALLRPATYEEIEADTTATPQAFLVVVVSSIATGIGTHGANRGGVLALVPAVIVSLVAWGAWALLTLQVGVRLLPSSGTRADLGELLRTIGFSSAPGLLGILGLVSPLHGIVLAVLPIWMLLTMIVAVRQALDYTNTARAVAVCIVGWLLALFIVWFAGLLSVPVA